MFFHVLLLILIDSFWLGWLTTFGHDAGLTQLQQFGLQSAGIVSVWELVKYGKGQNMVIEHVPKCNGIQAVGFDGKHSLHLGHF